ncbi:hypothetical protein MYX77_09180 [Acidobacteriia bacterium AH_259_A11_L15]|nr:hypothetical protein [Acidobacteriia bacterium AH_259_A11_L15]
MDAEQLSLMPILWLYLGMRNTASDQLVETLLKQQPGRCLLIFAQWKRRSDKAIWMHSNAVVVMRGIAVMIGMMGVMGLMNMMDMKMMKLRARRS